jgi:hypothetical protein
LHRRTPDTTWPRLCCPSLCVEEHRWWWPPACSLLRGNFCLSDLLRTQHLVFSLEVFPGQDPLYCYEFLWPWKVAPCASTRSRTNSCLLRLWRCYRYPGFFYRWPQDIQAGKVRQSKLICVRTAEWKETRPHKRGVLLEFITQGLWRNSRVLTQGIKTMPQ